MKNITTIQEATDAVYAEIQKFNPEIDKADVFDTILDEVLESAEDVITDADMEYLEKTIKTPEAMDKYLQTKIPDYQDLLEDIVMDMISEDTED